LSNLSDREPQPHWVIKPTILGAARVIVHVADVTTRLRHPEEAM